MVSGELKSLRITLEAVNTGVLGYVHLTEIPPGGVHKTVEMVPRSILADYDAEGRLLGVEFLQAQQANSQVMHELARQLNAPELAGIDLAEMCKSTS